MIAGDVGNLAGQEVLLLEMHERPAFLCAEHPDPVCSFAPSNKHNIVPVTKYMPRTEVLCTVYMQDSLCTTLSMQYAVTFRSVVHTYIPR